MSDKPSTNGRNGGRDVAGRFAKGNAGGPGNPFGRRVARLRSVLLDAVGEADLAEVAAGLVKAAKSGDVAAAKLLLSYTVGKPCDAVDPDRLKVEEINTVLEAYETLRQIRSYAVFQPEAVDAAISLVGRED